MDKINSIPEVKAAWLAYLEAVEKDIDYDACARLYEAYVEAYREAERNVR
jgi:hypothetical protein